MSSRSPVTHREALWNLAFSNVHPNNWLQQSRYEGKPAESKGPWGSSKRPHQIHTPILQSYMRNVIGQETPSEGHYLWFLFKLVSYLYSPGTNTRPTLPLGKQVFIINLRVGSNSVGAENRSHQGAVKTSSKPKFHLASCGCFTAKCPSWTFQNLLPSSEVYEVQPCWRKYILGGRLWMFKAFLNFQFALSALCLPGEDVSSQLSAACPATQWTLSGTISQANVYF